MLNISALDEKIIHLLETDGRQTSIMLGKALDVSPSTVRHRLNKLLSSGVLKITARVDPTKVGLHTVALINFDVAQGKVPLALKQLEAFPEVKWISVTTGRFDIAAIAAFPSTKELSAFLQYDIPKIDGVRDTESFICLEAHKMTHIPL